jgi:hypothetical protein
LWASFLELRFYRWAPALAALIGRGPRETAPFDLSNALPARAFDRCGRLDMSNP